VSSFLDKKGFLCAVPSYDWGKLVSVSDEEPYSTIFASLKHPIRRTILRMLSKKPMSFSEMLGVLGVSSSFLTYHLENLGELVGKIDDNKYRLSSFGEAAIATMTKVEDIPTTAPQQSPEHPETRSQKWSRPLRIIARAFKMSETKASETKSKKVVGRSVAIALGIICILLIAFIAYFSITGISAQNSYNNLQNQNKQLQTWLDGNETLLNQTQANNTNLQNQIDSLNSNVTNLQNQANNFHIGSTENSTILANNEIVHTNENVSVVGWENIGWGSVVGWENIGWGIYMPSGGFVSIRVSSNNNSTYVRLGTSYILNSTNSFVQTWPQNQFSVGFGGTVVFPVSPASWIEIYFGSSIGEATLTVTITYYY
jgi:cell division protein FtsB/DNA-binding HxlR family transcriptional regulator